MIMHFFGEHVSNLTIGRVKEQALVILLGYIESFLSCWQKELSKFTIIIRLCLHKLILDLNQ
jgi:hypothetical protein